jgi:diguanylate cyclase (GGDEF)-like protein
MTDPERVGPGPRETSGITISLIARHVRARAGEQGVAQLLQVSGVPLTAADLEGEHSWCSYADKIALFEAAATVLGDPAASRHIGETVLEHRVGLALKLLLRALGSPGQVVRNVARAAPKFSAVCTMDAVSVERTRAVVSYQLHAGHTPSRHDCDYNIGLLSQVAPLFGLPQAVVVHDACQVRGADRCIYRMSWQSRRRVPWQNPRSRMAMLEDQLNTVTEQSLALQSTIADLVSGDELSSVLARVATRAGTAVRATQYLLAVRADDEAPLSIHADGLADEAARTLAGEILAGAEAGDDHGDAAGSRLVVDVVSARRHYGRLAALNPHGLGFFPEERVLLAAYARHAAAALDAATALEAARVRGQTATVLLDLARALAGTTTPVDAARRIAQAAPDVVGGRRAVVALWEGDPGVLAVAAVHGCPPDLARTLLQVRVRRSDNSHLADLLAHQGPRWYPPGADDPFLGALLTALDSPGVFAAPALSRGDLLGVICLDNGPRPPCLDVSPVLEARMAGLADQAATALDNARLTEAQSRTLEELRASEQRNRHLATHDSLTGLPNRMLLTDRVGRALASARRHRHRLGLMFLDIDHFKLVNDDHGHDVGDDLLRAVAGRLRATVRDEDTMGRLGGDEFVLLLPRIGSAVDAEAVAAKVVAGFRRPFAVQGQDLKLTASIGVALYPEDGEETAALLRAADVAMYRAKDGGRDRYEMAGEGGSGRVHLDLGDPTTEAG